MRILEKISLKTEKTSALKVLVVSDRPHETQTFVLNAVRALESTGARVKSGFFGNTVLSQNYDVLFSFPAERPPAGRLLVAYCSLKIVRSISPTIRQIFDNCANWELVGRQIGTWYAVRSLKAYIRIRLCEVDIIHVHFAWNLPFIDLIAGMLKKPLFCTVHGSDVFRRRNWHQQLRSPYVSKILCVSQPLYDHIARHAPDLRSKLHIVRNPLNPIFFEACVPPPERLRIVCVASLRRLKNHVWLIQALDALRSRGLQFECAFIGEALPNQAFMEEEIRAEIDRYGLSGTITLTGRLCEKETKNEIDAATVLVLPSTSEGCGMVLIEALARCRCPVASDIPGCRDALRGGRYGVLVELNNIKALADAILTAHRNTVNAGQRIRHARQYLEEEFTYDAFTSRIERLYNES